MGFSHRQQDHAQDSRSHRETVAAMEAPLLAKVRDRIDRFATTWKKAVRFALLVAGGRVVAEKDIVPVFREVATVQPKTEAEVRLVNVQAGIPLVTQLRREGWTGVELRQMERDKEEEGGGEEEVGLREGVTERL